jgi:hypothetical protein
VRVRGFAAAILKHRTCYYETSIMLVCVCALIGRNCFTAWKEPHLQRVSTFGRLLTATVVERFQESLTM